jgi:hypothetical protein
MNSGEPGGNWGETMERSGLMSSEMTEQELYGGLKANGEDGRRTAGGKSRRLQAAQGRLSVRAEGDERAKRLRYLEFSGGAERSGTGRRRRPSGRG